MEAIIEIKYTDGEFITTRKSFFIPRKGDNIFFKDKVLIVTNVTWVCIDDSTLIDKITILVEDIKI